MADIKQSIQQLPESEKAIGNTLINFYEAMKALESDPERAGKQATLIAMTINDIEAIK